VVRAARTLLLVRREEPASDGLLIGMVAVSIPALSDAVDMDLKAQGFGS
jgi:hypothetical protein